MTGNWIDRLSRRVGLVPGLAEVAEDLVELPEIVAALRQAQVQSQATLEGLREVVEKLDRGFTRAGKEQFKANALAEAQQQHLKTLLEQVRQAETCREREVAQARQELETARAAGRLDLVKGLLPTLDGLGEALASGKRLLEGAGPEVADLRGPLAQRLQVAIKVLLAPGPPPSAAETLSRPAVCAWLEGLALVQERLIEVLAAEGVYPMQTAGEFFNPHRHVAVDTVVAEGAIEPDSSVGETRRGYVAGDTVLRYAEVVVARIPRDAGCS